LLVLVTIILGVFILFEWRPEQFIETKIHNKSNETQEPPDHLSLLSWNIGYAGLDRDADFFMDGGKQVRPQSMDGVRHNLGAIVDYLGNHSADIVLLQEVDRNSSRSFDIDQVAAVADILDDYEYARAINFKVWWIPYPLLKPIGRVESGLVSLSRPAIAKASRHQLPGSYSWPVRIFHLKRCLHEIRIKAPGGKDWVILHIHLSAFDADGHLRRQQMAYIRKLILKIHQQGHYVIVAGDWNHAFPGIAERQYVASDKTPKWFQRVEENWTPAGWNWAYDPNTPSLRATNKPYTPGENFLTSIDGYLVSPNLEIQKVEAFDLGFENSDHHPIFLQVAIKK
jgi:endonuclease/exonuclease/phosphatase family metal-dependent hydrolase